MYGKEERKKQYERGKDGSVEEGGMEGAKGERYRTSKAEAYVFLTS